MENWIIYRINELIEKSNVKMDYLYEVDEISMSMSNRLYNICEYVNEYHVEYI